MIRACLSRQLPAPPHRIHQDQPAGAPASATNTHRMSRAPTRHPPDPRPRLHYPGPCNQRAKLNPSPSHMPYALHPPRRRLVQRRGRVRARLPRTYLVSGGCPGRSEHAAPHTRARAPTRERGWEGVRRPPNLSPAFGSRARLYIAAWRVRPPAARQTQLPGAAARLSAWRAFARAPRMWARGRNLRTCTEGG